jgi:hypothetical protein
VNMNQKRGFHPRNSTPPVARPSLTLITRVLVLLVVWWSLPGYSQVVSSEQQPATREEPNQALGSLSAAGEVYVNGSLAVSESTIFAGDRVRTGPTGAASFAISGRATLKMFPQSEVVFSGSNQFSAELEAGTVVLSTVAGGSGMFLRMGDFVLVPSFPREQSTTSKAERGSDGSFTISSLDGSVGVLTLKDRSGEFLNSGQSLQVSSNTLATGEVAPIFSSKSMSKRFTPKAALQRTSPKEFALGAGGAGGIAYLVDRLIQGRSSPAVSPSTP